jgi:hypothetical protein
MDIERKGLKTIQRLTKSEADFPAGSESKRQEACHQRQLQMLLINQLLSHTNQPSCVLFLTAFTLSSLHQHPAISAQFSKVSTAPERETESIIPDFLACFLLGLLFAIIESSS